MALREFGDFAARLAPVDEDGSRRFGAEDDVFPDGQRGEQLERLMNHAHAGGDRIQRRAEAHFDAAQEDAPLVGRLQAVEDAHQGRLAGAVLAHHRVNLSALDGKIDVIVGEDGAVTLDDADRFQLRDRQAPGPIWPSSDRRP